MTEHLPPPRTTHTPWVNLLSSFPQLQPLFAFLHSPGILSTALLSSPNFSFTSSPSFFGSLEEQGFCLSECQDSATICSPWGNSGAFGRADPAILVGLFWDPLCPPRPPPPVPGHEQSYSTTTYSTGLCAKWFIYIISLYLQTTLGKNSSLYKSVN